MRGKHIGIMLGLALVVAGGLAACGKSSTTSQSTGQLAAKQTVKLSAKSEVTTLDVSKAADSTSLTMLYHTQEGLYRLGKNEKLINALATKTTVTNGGKRYVFDLRKTNHWNDGKPVTAHDFVYSWQRTANPKTASEYAYLMAGVKNFSQVQSGKLAPSQLGVKALGDYRLEVTLSKPVAYFKLLLAFPTFFPQEKSVVVKQGSDYGHSSTKTAYDGPFVMKKWTGTSQNWTLAKNPKFWDKKQIKLQTLNFQVVADPSTGLSLYQKKSLDATTLDGTQVANLKNNPDLKTYVGGTTYYMQMNQKRVKALKNLQVRQALSLAINKKQLASHVLRDGSKAPLGFVSQNLTQNPQTKADFAKDAYVKDGVAYDLPKAKKLMAAGLKASGTKQLDLTLMCDDLAVTKTVAQYIQAELEKLPNVKVTLNALPYKTRLSRSNSGNFDLVLSSWGADFADPINFLSLMSTGNTNNNGGFSDAQYDAAIKRSENQDANRPTARYQDLVTAEKRLMTQQGVIPLYQPATVELWNSKVTGYVWNPAGMSRGYQWMAVEK
ncbi:peptide ABC transporter substrate-binding protein [Levilactobacillus spicheri]|uniref:Peptide ABC transporter substrate-binding protein n=2 Tax=Levilactobacillus spicheri TaxID=216463 RepID=A0ABQ0WMF9_9LACO|nr:peptide ABC transporter substrate-binding protein [Levilactobacillus spicheri]GEO66166.1 peptide ABC transporter substrate-binding protein [Levilactobacillus spicheri]